MIKLYRLDSMDNTPFSSKNKTANNFFRKQDIEFTDRASECDLFITRRYSGIQHRILLKLYYGDRPILLWTHEPRFDTHHSSQLRSYPLLPSFHIMNVYTGDIHISNYTIYSWAIRESIPLIDKSSNSVILTKRRCIVFLSSYINQPKKHSLPKDGRDINLTEIRQKLGLIGHRQGLLDIYGKGWPNGLSIEDSRGSEWHNRKQDILKKYKFNLCLENTNYDYYCTEKIWDSIAGGCLPIYFGKHNRIYETFPRNSFIDVSEFHPFESVFDFIINMTKDEYIDRLNLCINAYNFLSKNREELKQKRQKMLDNIVNRIHAIAS